MSETLRAKVVAWIEENRAQLLDVASLWLAALLGEWLLMSSELPPRAIACALLIADAVPASSRLVGRRPARDFLRNLPYYAAVALATAALWHFAFQLPAASLGFVPLWLALNWLHRVALPRLWPRLEAFDIRHPASLARGTLLETCALGAGFYLASSFVPGFWPNRSFPAVAWLAWPAVRRLSFRLRLPGSPGAEWLRLVLDYLCFSAAVGGALVVWGSPLSRPYAVAFFWCFVGVAAARCAWAMVAASQPKPGSEAARWIVIAVAGFWLLRDYATFNLKGAGDAHWYGMMLADMLAQVHLGVFPVWMGQSITQFNGAIYPLRIAPGFHYLGALLDALTFRSLGVLAVQNLLLTLVGVGSVFCCYFGLAFLIPNRRWVATGLAIVFLACPGILGMIYKNDLFMSWVTVPWVVLTWYTTIQSFRDGGRLRTMVILGVALGLCWWGHSPIALWTTLIAAAIQVARMAIARPPWSGWLASGVGAATFLVVAAYPIGSVLLFPPEAGLRVDAFQQATGSSIAYFVRQVFPSTLLPLSPGAHELSDLQLGYTIWALLGFCLWNFRRAPVVSAGASFAAALFLLFLLTPIPQLNAVLWNAVPQFVRNATSNWAMNRLYLPLACAIVFGAAGMVSAGILEDRRRQEIFLLLAALGCAWSISEASKFHRTPYDPTLPASDAADMMRPENAVLTRFAYFIFPQPPDAFTHGTTDPAMETLLRSTDTLQPIASNYEAAKATARLDASGAFVPPVPGTANFAQLDKRFRIERGRSYLLDFSFPQGSATRGVIEIAGRTFHREYALPEYGGSKAFGAGGDHRSLVPLSTSSPTPVDLTLRYFPESAQPADPVIRVRFLEYDPSALPIRLESLIPYRVLVKSPAAAWLETPRMHQVGYIAMANGHRGSATTTASTRASSRPARSSTPGSSGPLMFIRGRYGHGGRKGYDREWRADPKLSGGGELIDQGVHLIDLAAGSSGTSRRSRGTPPPTSGT
jgi:hypothetical protein